MDSKGEARAGFLKDIERRIGRERSVAADVERTAPRDTRSVLMNPTRQQIFCLLHSKPCIHLTMLARKVDIAPNSLKWHLDKLEKRGFITSHRMGNRLVFFPTDMIPEHLCESFFQLNKEVIRGTFVQIIARPGISQKDVKLGVERNHQAVHRSARVLVQASMVEAVKDGTLTRYYPTDIVQEWTRDIQSRLRNYREGVLKRMREDALDPEVERATDKVLIVKVRTGVDRSILTLHTDPVATILQDDPTGPSGIRLPR